MTLNIVQRLTPYNYSDGNRGMGAIRYIVIHYFGSLGSAAGVANYFASAYRGASAHYILDEGPTVYQCVRDKDIAWHCGTSGAYRHPYCRNSNSIGIEVRPLKLNPAHISVEDRDWYFPTAIMDNLVQLTKMLMQRYNIPAENVIRHYDVTGKWCPRPLLGDDTNQFYKTSGNKQWAIFKARLTEEELDMNKDELLSTANTGDNPSPWAKKATDYCKAKGIFNGDGKGNYGWQVPITREAVAQIIFNAFEAAGVLDKIPDA